MDETTVSVIMPCYNNEEGVSSAIESALNQTHEPMEVIVVDDGSTDASLERIQSYEERIRWNTGPNRGACHARNKGLDMASGDFVKFLDADDWLYPGAIEHQVAQTAALQESHHVVFGDAEYVTPKGTVVRETTFEAVPDEDNRILHILQRNLQTALPLHRRELLEAVGGFDESLPRAQEYDLHFRLTGHGARFVYRPALIVRVLEHGDPDRISNQDHFSGSPRGRLERIQHRATVAEECGLLDERLRAHLARDAWHGGRKALRAGFSLVADEYFETAKSLHENDYIASSSEIYRWMVKLAGPQLSERLVTFARRVF
ncbi:MAG: family 2 glycosyl transferase [Bacteroidetes bacterium SW_9_63_38]|nr:MAG: family 2 glycosyl transferase [Bacteroidetes bacterium SW_9_63_38]